MGEAGSLSITLRRSGGILPGPVLETHVREQDLEPEQAERLRALVTAADLDRRAARSPITGPGADMYQYEVVVEADGQVRRVVVSGSHVPTELRALVDFLEQRAK